MNTCLLDAISVGEYFGTIGIYLALVVFEKIAIVWSNCIVDLLFKKEIFEIFSKSFGIA